MFGCLMKTPKHSKDSVGKDLVAALECNDCSHHKGAFAMKMHVIRSRAR